MKRALITGVTGQDGSYLAELLLSKGYEVHGIKRRSSSFNTDRVNHIFNTSKNFTMHYGDLTDATNLIRIIQMVQPDEIYNLGAQSHVKVSFETPEYTANSDAIGTLRMLEALRILGMEHVKFYQASTSEMYGLYRRILSLRRLLSIHVHPTVWQNCMHTGSRRTIVSPMACLPALVSCSTMSLLVVVRPL